MSRPAPHLAVVALILNIVALGSVCLDAVFENPSENFKYYSYIDTKIRGLGPRMYLVQLSSLASGTALALCVTAIYVAYQGGGPSSVAGALLGSTGYHAGLAFLWSQQPARAEGANPLREFRLHAALAVCSFAAVLNCHWARWGGRVKPTIGNKPNRAPAVARVALALNAAVGLPVGVALFAHVNRVVAAVLPLIAPALTVDSDAADIEAAISSYAAVMTCMGMACAASFAATATGGGVEDTVAGLFASTVGHLWFAATVHFWGNPTPPEQQVDSFSGEKGEAVMTFTSVAAGAGVADDVANSAKIVHLLLFLTALAGFWVADEALSAARARKEK